MVGIKVLQIEHGSRFIIRIENFVVLVVRRVVGVGLEMIKSLLEPPVIEIFWKVNPYFLTSSNALCSGRILESRI